MRSVIEQDICATCAHLRPSKPLPTDKCVPPFGVFDIQCDCAKGWPYTGVFVSANARSECPEFTTTDAVMQPNRPWPFPAQASGSADTEGPDLMKKDPASVQSSQRTEGRDV